MGGARAAAHKAELFTTVQIKNSILYTVLNTTFKNIFDINLYNLDDFVDKEKVVLIQRWQGIHPMSCLRLDNFRKNKVLLIKVIHLQILESIKQMTKVGIIV